MAPLNRLRRSLFVLQARGEYRWRRSTKWIRDRRRSRLAVPPATTVASEKVAPGVLEIRLEGGERRNVLGRSTIDRIEELVSHPPDGIKVLVITAVPPDFCAGYDLIEASQGQAENLIALEDNFEELRRSRIPIVVALHGNVIGGGLELALSADIRLASPETKFSIPASKLGLVYSKGGIRLVVNAVGESVARSLFLAGRDISAESALTMGLVAEIVGREQLRNRAVELAVQIASWSEVAVTGNRQILDAVVGRIDVDANELHLGSFIPGGDLMKAIADFVARRARSMRRVVE